MSPAPDPVQPVALPEPGPSPVTDIRNIGPAMAEPLARVGLISAEQVREIGADRTYSLLLEAGSRPHFIAYYALVMGLQGRPWNDCKGAEKDALRDRFDALKAEAATARLKPSPATDGLPPDLAATLNEIGVLPGR